VSRLAGLAYLETLNLSGTRVTARLLEELPRWPALKTVFLFNTDIEEAQLAALRKAGPQLTVHGSRIDVSDSLYYAQLGTPELTVDSLFFRRAATVSVKPSRGKIDYYYTLDGSPPGKNSPRYAGPFPVRASARLRMIASMEGWKDSKPAEARLLHLAVRPAQSRWKRRRIRATVTGWTPPWSMALPVRRRTTKASTWVLKERICGPGSLLRAPGAFAAIRELPRSGKQCCAAP
jgi:hypothetical protein